MNGTTLDVLYFARVAELTGVREESWPLAAPIAASAWLRELEARYPRLAPVSRLKLAVNQQHSPHDRVLQPGDEVAVFDPVTGG
ncbi:MoaD/ThiS family protein [Paracandidimonas soli]|uniref:Molybdopterin synthase sulfur carrier subunit n=1 Tax=Paracandidimonas soli TaxID=1917182 RepID=A0A4R3V8D0_9BURK|nr:MoaD/ThiS family protein [Paracandidimonas soli]TCV01366.1 molybdopterin synthase subunit MoaD [Paracandidimonas soli]